MFDRSEEQKKAILEIMEVVVNVKTLTLINKIKRPETFEAAISSDEFQEVLRIYKLMPRHAWLNYKALGVKYQAEQELLEEAVKNFLFRLKFLVQYENKSDKPAEDEFDCNPFLDD